MEGWGPELAVIFGVVEGLTEFLPVSSTGHMILVGHWLGFDGDIAASVEISIQLGSVLAIMVYERSKIAMFLSRAWGEWSAFRALLGAGKAKGAAMSQILRESAVLHAHLWFILGLGAAFVPAAAVGLMAHHWIETHLFNPTTVAVSLIVGGVVLLLVEARQRAPRVVALEQVGIRSALAVGLAQCLSLIPGTSRSGSTIVGGLLAGLDRKTATEYSFFLALPTMLAATGYKLIKSRALLSESDALALGLGLVVSFLVAWVVIAAFLAYVKKHSLRPFAYYRIVLGIVVLAFVA